MVRGPDCGWCGRELDGLRENIIRTDVGQLLFDHLFVVEKSGDINVFGRYESGYALVSLCEQGLSRAKKIEKLLWHVPSTERPKSLSHSAGKEDAIVVTFFHMRMTISGFDSAANLIIKQGMSNYFLQLLQEFGEILIRIVAERIRGRRRVVGNRANGALKRESYTGRYDHQKRGIHYIYRSL